VRFLVHQKQPKAAQARAIRPFSTLIGRMQPIHQ
jgi:hypothetical protein